MSSQQISIALDTSRNRAILATYGQVRIIDTRTGKQLHAIGLPSALPLLAVDPTTGHVFVQRSDNKLSMLDANTGKQLHTIVLGHGLTYPASLAVDDQSRRVFILDQGCCVGAPTAMPNAFWRGGTVSVIDADSGDLLDTVAVGGAPSAMVVDERAGHLLVFNHGFGNSVRATVPRLVGAVSWWRVWQGRLPWFQSQTAPTPDLQQASVSVLDATL